MKNIMAVDLESWIHYYHEATKTQLPPGDSQGHKALDDRYIAGATRDLLDLLDKYGQKITFFVVGEIYEWYPDLIEEIEKRGHEIGYHTHNHSIVRDGGVMERELEKSREFVKRFKPLGFRAPQIYITPDSLACLKKWGFKYSSSTYDGRGKHAREGIDEIPVSTFPFRPSGEIDAALPRQLTLKMMLREIPFGSGLFLGLLGAKISHFIDRLNRKNVPAVMFVHPWQLYAPPAMRGWLFKLKVLFRNPLSVPYTRNVLESFEKLLKNYRFATFKEYYYEH